MAQWSELLETLRRSEDEVLERLRHIIRRRSLMLAIRLMPTCRGKVEAIKQSSSFDAERSLQLRNNRSASHRSHAMNQKLGGIAWDVSLVESS